MREYLELGKRILREGVEKEDRTGTGTYSIFGHQMRFDLAKGFPLVTTKDMLIPNKFGVSRLDIIIEELRWFLSGDTNIKTLVDKGINIWNRDAYKRYEREYKLGTPMGYEAFVQAMRECPVDSLFVKQWGNLGAIYGKQWRAWETGETVYDEGDYPRRQTIDQIQQVIKELRENPDSRRHIISAWNVGKLEGMTLPPCHTLFQFYAANGKLSCQLYQRSGDYLLGVPMNIASYSLLTMMIAQVVGLEPGEFIHTFGDVHIYKNHIEQVREQVMREPKELPKMNINPFIRDIEEFKREDFELEGYECHPSIKGEQSA